MTEKSIFNLLLLSVIVYSVSSCGTIMGKMNKVTLVDAPSNLTAKADGETVDIKTDLSVSTLKVGTNADTYTDYYAPTIKLNKHKTVDLQLSFGSSNGTVNLSPKFSGGYFLGNMFFFGLITGTIVDVATGNHRKHIRFVDVPAVLAGKPQSEWRSKSQLKKAIKKSARK